jgi:hypothetical protein
VSEPEPPWNSFELAPKPLTFVTGSDCLVDAMNRLSSSPSLNSSISKPALRASQRTALSSAVMWSHRAQAKSLMSIR